MQKSLNSCLYRATVMHHRFKPKPHRFHYKVFMFWIDLDEIALLKKNLLFFSHNRFNVFSLKDHEHLQLPPENPDTSKSIKEHIICYMKQNGLHATPSKIMLLTNLNILGYNFNPVSFYYCFDENNQPLCSIAEVGNTFKEMKPYLLTSQHFKHTAFELRTAKHFYVSPFFNLDTQFDFKLAIPEKKLHLKIDTYDDGEKVFTSTLTGGQTPLTNLNLFWYGIRFPLLTVQIITLIHWHALLLWMKKIPYHKKSHNPQLQQGVFRKYNPH